MLKPTLGPFALFGIRQRAWWCTALVLALASLPFLPLWPDYVRATVKARSPLVIFYSIQEWPMLLVPLLAWWGRTRRGIAWAEGRER